MTQEQFDKAIKSAMEYTLLSVLEDFILYDKSLISKGKKPRCQTACKRVNKALMELEQCQM